MKFRNRGFVSLLLALIFLTASVSGVILYLTPRGRTANWSGWTMLGLDKHEWSAVHINACLLLIIVGVIHLILNWGIFWRYIRTKAEGFNLKLEMAVAVLVTGAVIVGTLTHIPPFTATTALNDKIKNYWDQGTAQGPAPHAEEFTLDRFASSVGLSVDDVLDALKKEGIEVEDGAATVGEVAEENGLVPRQVFSAVTKHFPEAAAVAQHGGMGRGMGRGMGGGMGRGMGGGMGGGMGHGMGNRAGDETQGDNAMSGEPGEIDDGVAADDDHEHRGFGMGPGGGRGMGRGMGGGMGRGWGWAQGEAAGGEAKGVERGRSLPTPQRRVRTETRPVSEFRAKRRKPHTEALRHGGVFGCSEPSLRGEILEKRKRVISTRFFRLSPGIG